MKAKKSALLFAAPACGSMLSLPAVAQSDIHPQSEREIFPGSRRVLPGTESEDEFLLVIATRSAGTPADTCSPVFQR